MSQGATSSFRIPVYLLTGFLGSGKTTLLNHLVNQPAMTRTLVIINEFGRISLDHLLVSHANEEVVVELGSGCVCCTIRGDLAKTLRDISWRYSRQGVRQFDRVIIETTGLADPAPILHTLMTDRTLFTQFRLQGVVTTIDALHGEATLNRHPESQKQVAMADLLLLTKTDLAQQIPGELAALRQRLQQLNPAAPQLEPLAGVLDPDELLRLDHIEPVQSVTPLEQWLNVKPFSAVNISAPALPGRLFMREMHMVDPTQAAALAAEQNRHDDHIQAHCFTFQQPLSEGRFEGWLQMMMQLMGHNMLRIKGIIHLKGCPGPMIVHGVQHIFHPAAFLPAWPDENRDSKLVFITYDIDREVIERTFDLFLLEGVVSV